MANLTHERLRHLLNYDPETGVFTRRVDVGGGRYKAGTPAGSVCGRYRVQWIDGKPYLEHRVAWFWMTGTWPKHQIDHINLDKLNNRWVNLRESTISQNSMNKRGRAVSGFKGVCFMKDPSKCGPRRWRATITKEGKLHRLGFFATAEEAGEAYHQAALKFHGEFARVA